MAQEHVIILRFSALGDVAMTLPVVYSVAEANPSVRFTIVTRPFFARLFINPPANLEVMRVDMNEYRGLGGMRRLLGLLSGLKPTAVADLHNVLRTWVIDRYFLMKGCKVAMVNKKRARRRQDLRSGCRQQDFIDRYVEVFGKLGLRADLSFKALDVAECGVDVRHPAIGVAPFARYFNKTYPPGLMRKVIETLCADGYEVWLFGARGAEAATLEEWASDIPGCQSVAGHYTLEQELALIGKMDVMVAMDSANQHLASLMGVPVVTLWGSTTPECGFMPYRQPPESSLIARLDCQPCSVAGKAECPRGHFKCMRDISPETVVEKVKGLC